MDANLSDLEARQGFLVGVYEIIRKHGACDAGLKVSNAVNRGENGTETFYDSVILTAKHHGTYKDMYSARRELLNLADRFGLVTIENYGLATMLYLQLKLITHMGNNGKFEPRYERHDVKGLPDWINRTMMPAEFDEYFSEELLQPIFDAWRKEYANAMHAAKEIKSDEHEVLETTERILRKSPSANKTLKEILGESSVIFADVTDDRRLQEKLYYAAHHAHCFSDLFITNGADIGWENHGSQGKILPGLIKVEFSGTDRDCLGDNTLDLIKMDRTFNTMNWNVLLDNEPFKREGEPEGFHRKNFHLSCQHPKRWVAAYSYDVTIINEDIEESKQIAGGFLKNFFPVKMGQYAKGPGFKIRGGAAHQIL